MAHAYAEIAFTANVRAEQSRNGSAEAYAGMLSDTRGGGATLTEREILFLHARDGFVQATVNEDGWPYVQFRGGTPGFLRVLDLHTVAFADYSGNAQYISTGNLQGNDRISILAIDYARRKRLKLLGRVQISEDPQVIEALNSPDGPPAERAFIIRVAGFDWNCPRHIPQRMTDEEYGGELARQSARIKTLEQDRIANP